MLGKRKVVATAAPSKRRKKSASTTEEISFDFNARSDYLTGFHKRKLQRIKRSQEEAAKKGREDKIQARRMLREGRRADLEKHVEEVDLLMRKANREGGVSDSDSESSKPEEWDGIAEVPKIDHEEEYLDEDRHTTVTIEAVDVTKEGLHKVVEQQDSEDGDEKNVELGGTEDTPKGKRVWTKERPKGPKKRKKKFKYESKVDRKATRYKERSGNRAKAKARKDD